MIISLILFITILFITCYNYFWKGINMNTAETTVDPAVTESTNNDIKPQQVSKSPHNNTPLVFDYPQYPDHEEYIQ